jgi:hypothetical protein
LIRWTFVSSAQAAIAAARRLKAELQQYIADTEKILREIKACEPLNVFFPLVHSLFKKQYGKLLKQGVHPG